MNTGYMKNLKKYKVKNMFNIIKHTNQQIETVAGNQFKKIDGSEAAVTK